MKRLSFATSAGAFAITLCAALAYAQPAVIPRIGRASHDATATYRMLKRYFADPTLSQFRLISADAAKRTIVARRPGIDSATWTKWAYCKVSTTELIYSLANATATVRVKVDPAGPHSSEVRVTADLEGTYKLGSNQTSLHCISNGVLEQSILATAGVPASAN
jgi:hypothetical protein